MGLENFIPQLWAADLLEELETALIFYQVINRRYEGQIQGGGSSVKINSLGEITIGNYVKNTDIDAPETLDSASLQMIIDQQKYFHFYVDDIDKVQAKPDLRKPAMKKAAYKLRKIIDAWIAAKYVDAGIQVNNAGAAYSVAATGGDITPFNLVVDLGVKFDEKDIPDDDRWLVVPPFMHGELLKSEEYKLAFEDYKKTGKIPVVDSFHILKSNNIAAQAGTYHAMAGTSEAISFAMQLTELEAYRPERRFGDAIKALNVYGAKVVHPEQLADVQISRVG